MRHFVKAHSGVQPPVLPVAVALMEAPASTVFAGAPFAVPAPAEHAPPGMLSLRI